MIRLLICMAVLSSAAFSIVDTPDFNSGSKDESRDTPDRLGRENTSLTDNETQSRRYEQSESADAFLAIQDQTVFSGIEIRISDICDSDDVVTPEPPASIFHSSKR